MADVSPPKGPDPSAGETPDTLFPLLYQQLRRFAAGFLRNERPDHTLQLTALVNEACLRLAGQREAKWADRARFLAIASHVMREVLIDHARMRMRAKMRSGPGAGPPGRRRR
jgi:RNA polymerase sigma-70 factor (ECF subfamily)